MSSELTRPDSGRADRSVRARLSRWFSVGFRPVATPGWEWALMRIAFAVLVWQEISSARHFGYPDQPVPHGLAVLFDLTWLGRDWVMPAVRVLGAAALLLYVAGRRLPLVLPFLTLLHCLPHTLQNSQGSISHSHQLVTLVLLAQAVTAVWLWVRARRGGGPPDGLSQGAWLVFYSKATVASIYVLAGLSKAFNSKLLWVWNSPYLSFDLVKAQRQEYFKRLDPEHAGDVPLAALALEHAMVARLVFGGAFLLELLALLALKNRTWACVIGLGLLALHGGIHLVMHLRFVNHEWLILIFLVNVPWMIMVAAGRLRPGRTIQGAR